MNPTAVRLIAPLSRRQIALVACLIDGLGSAEAAQALGVNRRTEMLDMRKVRKVLGARNRQHAAAIAGGLAA